MRSNIAISSNATFRADAQETGFSSTRDLPMTFMWRSGLWLFVVPTLWLAGWLVWTFVAGMETPDRGIVLYALLFIGMPGILALAGAWWVRQLLDRRTSAKLVITEDYIDWQFEMGSDLDPLVDCSRFNLAGRFGFDARIEWDIRQDDDAGLLQKLLRLDWIKSDRALYGRDVGLDRPRLERLCKLLNQLREEAMANR